MASTLKIYPEQTLFFSSPALDIITDNEEEKQAFSSKIEEQMDGSLVLSVSDNDDETLTIEFQTEEQNVVSGVINKQDVKQLVSYLNQFLQQ